MDDRHHIEAVGTVLRSGRTLTVRRLDVHGQRDGEQTPIHLDTGR